MIWELSFLACLLVGLYLAVRNQKKTMILIARFLIKYNMDLQFRMNVILGLTLLQTLLLIIIAFKI